MADFLTSLLDRALEQAPILQRRRPSLFEPRPEAGRLSAMRWSDRAPSKEATTLDEETVEFRDASPTYPSAPIVPPESSLLSATAAPHRTKPEPALLWETVFQPPASIEKIVTELVGKAVPAGYSPHEEQQRTQRPSAARSPGGPRAAKGAVPITAPPEAIRAAPATIPPTSLLPRPPRVAPSSSQSLESKEDTAVSAPSRLRREAPSGSRADEMSRTRRQSDTVHAHNGEPVFVKRVRLAPSPARRSLPQARRRATKPPSTAATTTGSAPPAVQVTIGRVEVRATPSQAPVPTQATRPAKPKLSLQDYLRSRGGGTT